MTLTGKTTVYKHPKAATLYIAIPAAMASDSVFPFKDKDQVELVVECGYLMVSPYIPILKVGEPKDEKA